MAQNSQQKTHDDYTVAIVCALSYEMTAVRYMLTTEHTRLKKKPHDDNMYVFGELHGHNVVVACLPGQQGKGAAATVAVNMARFFPSIKWRLLVGIAGGVPEKHDIRLGDVVVSMPEGTHGGVVQYDLGKATDDGFQRKGFLWPPPSYLRSAVEMMKSDQEMSGGNKVDELVSRMLDKGPGARAYQRRPSTDDLLFSKDYPHNPHNASCVDCDRSKVEDRSQSRPDGLSVTHYGLVASGDIVMKSAIQRDEVACSLGDVLSREWFGNE
ncbi:hypothetical protein ACHAQH_009533 [Verticillium albo-atrum]